MASDDDLGFVRLPPTVLAPTPSPSTVTAGATDQAQPTGRWYGTLISGATGAWVVHLFADPSGYNIVVGAEVTLPATSVGATVVVGFFEDNSVAIVGVP